MCGSTQAARSRSRRGRGSRSAGARGRGRRRRWRVSTSGSTVGPVAAERRRRRLQRVDAAAQARGQDLLELDQRAHRGLLDAGHRRAGGRAQPDRDRDGLVVVEQQRRHRRAGVQPVAAGRPGERVHRVAEVAQPLDVAADRAAADLEAPRELLAGPVAPGLQQREELQQAAGGLGHRTRQIAGIAASICPKSLPSLAGDAQRDRERAGHQRPRPRQVLRRRARARRRRLRGRGRAPSSACSAPTARARRPPCAC